MQYLCYDNKRLPRKGTCRVVHVIIRLSADFRAKFWIHLSALVRR